MTLTEAAFWTKRVVVIGGVVLLLVVIVTYILLSIPKDDVPTEYLQANFACTETKEEFLTQQLQIPSLTLAAGSDLVYEIETETGRIDSLPRVINVYKYNNPGQSLSSQSDAKSIAEGLGFDPESIERRGGAEYVWTNPDTAQTLVVQARNLNFTLTTDFTRPNSLGNTKLPTDEEAKTIATDFLRSNSLLPEDYSVEPPQVVYIDIQPDGSFIQAQSRGEADLARIDFYRSKPMITIRSDLEGADAMKTSLESKLFDSTTETVTLDGDKIDVYNFETAVVTSDTQKSNISVYVGPDFKEDSTVTKKIERTQIYGMDYMNWVIEDFACGTYELIPPSSAVDLIQQGSGNLVYLNVKNGDEVIPYQPRAVSTFKVFNVTIGYYDGPTEQEFLQPVYIVSGEATFADGATGSFYYYVPAINYANIQNKVIETTTDTATEQDPTNLLNN